MTPPDPATIAITELARKLGRAAFNAYVAEFNSTPKADGWRAVRVWESAAWQCHWEELRDAGATEATRQAFRNDWEALFWA